MLACGARNSATIGGSSDLNAEAHVPLVVIAVQSLDRVSLGA
jgi:hypothetical protein